MTPTEQRHRNLAAFLGLAAELEARKEPMLTHSVVNRVIQEVAGTIATKGIQELSSEERGGISTRGYVCVCLKATAYNSVRSMPGFDMSYGDFGRAVDSTVDAILTPIEKHQ